MWPGLDAAGARDGDCALLAGLADLDGGRYAEALSALAGLRAPVDRFFDDVMVNADDARIRANRLALLARVAAAMNAVADISKLEIRD